MLGDNLPRLIAGKPEEFSATVIFGGPQLISQDSNIGYIKEEIEWIGEQVKCDSPLLGICLGAQMISASLGYAVGPHPQGLREIGFHSVRPTPEGKEFFPSEALFYQWHREGFELPKDSRLLATGDIYQNQAFSLGSSVFGLQFHPEITVETINKWITSVRGAPQLNRPEAQAADQQRLLASKCVLEVKKWLPPFLKKWLHH